MGHFSSPAYSLDMPVMYYIYTAVDPNIKLKAFFVPCYVLELFYDFGGSGSVIA